MTIAPPFRITVLYRGAVPNQVAHLLAPLSDDDPLLVVARTIATTGTWHPERPPSLVVRTGPKPLLVAVGRIAPRDEALLAALRWQLTTVLPRLRYLDHAAVTDACLRLADQLVDHLGPDLDRATFAAIPRGGLIVLGQLAYALGLRHDQLALGAHDSASDTSRPLVVVDDCLLSGVRSQRFLDSVRAPRVVLAALASHPDLRRALMEQRSDVEQVLSPVDLCDHAPALYGDDYGPWRERWRQRSSPEAAWIGQPDHVCFPWHEPDVGVWDPDAGDVVRGWGMLPGALCLAQRRRAAEHAIPWRVEALSEGHATRRLPASVVHTTVDGTVIVGDVDRDVSVALEGAAATMWQALMAHEGEQRVLADLVETFDADPDTLLDDLRAFEAKLVAHGLLCEEAPT